MPRNRISTEGGHPLRRLLRFRLRTLLAALAVMSLFLGWLSRGLHRAAGQRDAVRTLAEIGARAYYDHELDETGALLALRKPTGGQVTPFMMMPRGATQIPTTSLRPDDWRRRLLGDDFFDGIQRVDLDYCNFHGSELRRLEAFPKLRVLNLSWSNVTDEDLDAVACLPQLEALSLAATEITDDGLRRLAGTPRLKSLSLRDTYVSDAGLHYLEKTPSLEEVFLGNADVTREGVARLKANLPHCAIDEFVAGKPGLRYRGDQDRDRASRLMTE